MENDGVDSVADSDEEVRWRLTSQRRYGNSMPDRDAATRRHPGMVSAGGNHDGPAFWQDTTSIARGADRMARRLRSNSRDPDRCQPRRRPAQPCLDGSAWSDPRDDGAGAVSDVEGRNLSRALCRGADSLC